MAKTIKKGTLLPKSGDEHFATEDENNDKSVEEILLATVDGLTDDKLTGFALRLVLTGNIPIPREGEVDSVTVAESAFVRAEPKKTATKKAKAPMQIKARLQEVHSKKASRSLNPQRESDHRLPLLSRRRADVSVHLQT